MGLAPTTTGARGMVAAAFPAASEAGREILRDGGNAVDAAVAAAWALSVCEPSGSGLGGQSVLLVRTAAGVTTLVDGHSRAPAGVSREEVTRRQQRAGYRSCTVPTTPAVLAHAQRRFGALPAARVLAPAIRLAREGYEITRLQRRQLRWCRAALTATPAGRRFLGSDGMPPRIGDVFRQPRLANALERLADHGARDFYEGDIARAIVEDMARHGGLLGAGDLAAVGEPSERDPVCATYADAEVITAPPPGGGVELLLALKLLARLGAATPAVGPGRWYAHVAEAVYTAYCERERRPVRPRDWDEELATELLDDGRADALAAGLQEGSLAAAGTGREEAGDTTHLCAADEHGNVVSLTQSIQSLFGAKVANDRYGFLYNNYLLTCPRRRHRYRLRSRGLARSNAVPTIVLDRAGEPVLAVGAAGSRRIVSALVHVISGVLDRGMGLGEALAVPRIHARLSRAAWVERDAPTEAIERELAHVGLRLEPKARHSFCMGAVQAVGFGQDGTMVGACDPRREGAPRGL
jgi:gamma-glutamyltranspeptidase/glutathione hydrolase